MIYEVKHNETATTTTRHGITIRTPYSLWQGDKFYGNFTSFDEAIQQMNYIERKKIRSCIENERISKLEKMTAEEYEMMELVS